MSNKELKEISFGGIVLEVPQKWEHTTESFVEEDGTESFRISACSTGKKVKSIDVSLGNIPEGSDSYLETCRAYEEILGEDPSSDEEPIVSFGFRGNEAHGFSVYMENGTPCFFFCTDLPSKRPNTMLSILLCAPDDAELGNLMDFIEEHLH